MSFVTSLIRGGKTTLRDYYEGLRESSELVIDGYGEYLVYDTTGKKLTTQNFEFVYQIFNNFVHNPEIETASLTSFLSHEVKKIDPDLEVAFIPRTLYDLVYIVAAIEEEIERKANCPLQRTEISDFQRNLGKFRYKNTCWHTIFPQDGLSPPDMNELNHLAYRLNQYMLEKLRPNRRAFTGNEIVRMTAIPESF